MTSHPPSGQPSVPPTGPPSGPLSGPSTRPGQAAPPPPPPHDGSRGGGGGGGDGSGGGGDSGGTGGGAQGGGGGGPWYRSIPKVASLTAVVVAAVALVVVLTQSGGDKSNQGGGAGGGEVFLQNTSASGPDPFTASTARTEGATISPPALPSASGEDANATRSVTGSTPGLYGGTHRTAACDVEQQIRFLADEPAKNAAFASTVGVTANEVPGFLRSLTPVQLRVDTRVTNHGFSGGKATSYQSVLQAGTAVMVDDRGVPRVRCACGNPLTPPVAQQSPKPVGQAWPGYRTSNVVYVQPSVTVINVFVIYDPNTDRWIARQSGDTGRHDQHTTPPARPTPSTSPSSPVPCVTVTGTQTPTPSGGVTPSPCPSTLTPTSPTPSTSTPTPTPSTSTPSSPVTPSTPTESTASESTPATDLTSNGSTTDGSTTDGSTTDGGTT